MSDSAQPRKRAKTLDDHPLAERERIYQELDRTPTAELLARAMPLTRADAALQRKMREQIKRRRGRPKVGNGGHAGTGSGLTPWHINRERTGHRQDHRDCHGSHAVC